MQLLICNKSIFLIHVTKGNSYVDTEIFSNKKQFEKEILKMVI